MLCYRSDGKDFIYVINTIFAVVAMIGCSFIMPMEEPPKEQDTEANQAPESPPSTFEVVIQQAVSASKLFLSDPKMPMMMGMNLSFGTGPIGSYARLTASAGVAAAYINSYTTGIVANYFLYVDNG